MHTDNVETTTAAAPAPRKPLDQLTASEYLSLSKEDKAFYRKEGKAGSGPKNVSARTSFIAAAATFKTDKERKELALAATPKGWVAVYSGLSKASAGHLHDMGVREADKVKDLPSVVVFEGGAKTKKTIVSDKAVLVSGALELLEALEDAKENGLPRNHPERRAIVKTLRSIGK